MDTYLERVNSLFSPPKERTFTDRSEILGLLNEALMELTEGSERFQVFSINGIGGIGKTRLVKEFMKILNPEPIVYVSFEIEKRDEVISNLYRIRKVISSPFPFFDYALLRYWEMTNPAAINEDFMMLFHKNFFIETISMFADIIGCSSSGLSSTISIPSIPSPNSIVEFMNSLVRKVPQMLHKDIFKALGDASEDSLAERLPALLGLEINRLIQNGAIDLPVFIFDSYQESQPYSESEEWLLQLISEVGNGLFVITSREPLHWSKEGKKFTFYRLDCYPENEAQKLLEETITDRPDLVEIIIESTQCVPIYIDLALEVYEKEKNIIGEDIVEKALFRDRHKLVQHFISHLKPSWQIAILDLATIRVFNSDIFDYLVNQRMLNCAGYEYETIINGNLFNYISKSTNSSLVKLHDVFCRDAQAERTVKECYSIFETYLTYISSRRDFLVLENHGATLVALFQNAVSLAITIEERLQYEVDSSATKLNVCTIEKLLDIFFTIVAHRIRFTPLRYEGIKTESIKKLCQFVHAKMYEKDNTRKTIEALESIQDVSCFGKHKLSYEAVLIYTKSLVGNYKELEDWVSVVDQSIGNEMKSEWFYNRIKVYQADCDILYGRFKSAMASLILLQDNITTIEDHYAINRTIGHIHRFNFLFEEAEKDYTRLLTQYKNNTIFKEYLSTNLIETGCYFPTPAFIRYAKKTLASMIAPYNVKNKGKVLYSLAIANTVKKHYRSAQACINECIEIYQNDGYQSGELFAYMAQAYLDYALKGFVSNVTYEHIEDLLNRNKVYEYFRLALAIMNEDAQSIYNLESEYEWIDFAHTEAECRRFLAQLH